MPVEQVLRAPVRPQQRHVHHHQQLSSTTLRLRVAVGFQVVSASHPVRLRAVPRPPARGPAAAAATYPGVVFRDQIRPAAAAVAATYPGVVFRDQIRPAAVAVTAAGQPTWPAVSLVHTALPPAAPVLGTPAARASRGALPPVELVHRLPSAPAPGAVTSRPADARVNGTDFPAGTRWAGPGGPARTGATPLTAADVPGVVDQVVREIDRRVVAARERRGWTA